MELSQEDLEFYKKQFNEGDTDGDGFISLDEFRSGGPDLSSASSEELAIWERILADADFDQDKRFSFDEFLSIMEMIMIEVQKNQASLQ